MAVDAYELIKSMIVELLCLWGPASGHDRHLIRLPIKTPPFALYVRLSHGFYFINPKQHLQADGAWACLR